MVSATAVAFVMAACAASPQAPERSSRGCIRPDPPSGRATLAEIEAFSHDTTRPADLKLTPVTTSAGGAQEFTVDFESPDGGRVSGLMWVPTGSGPFAGIIAQHGIPQTAADMRLDGMALARRGAIVIAITAPIMRRGAPPHAPTDSADQVRLIRELQRATDILMNHPDVDRKRLGYFGYSYGAAMGALLAGVERRISTYVLAAGDGGLVSHFTGPDDPPALIQRIPCQWLASMTPIEPIRFVPLAAPASLFFQAAEYDEFVPTEDARRLHNAASEPKRVKWYPTGHDLGDVARADRAAWFSAEIGLTR